MIEKRKMTFQTSILFEESGEKFSVIVEIEDDSPHKHREIIDGILDELYKKTINKYKENIKLSNPRTEQVLSKGLSSQ